MTTARRARPAGQGRDAKGTTGIDRHDTGSPAARLLERLEGIRQTGADRWLARCPAHEDRTPSLSIRENDNGTVLLKCWAGCGAADIVAAVGLELRDLFPPPLPTGTYSRPPIRRRDRWSPRDLLLILRREATVVLLAAEDVMHDRPLADADRDRLHEAMTRISTVCTEVSP